MTILRTTLAGSALALVLPAIAAAQSVDVEIVPLADWSYDELYTAGASVDNLLDADVYGPTGDEIGEVENVLFSADGRLLAVVAEIGGFIEIGDTHVSIPWDVVEVGPDADDITVPVTQETIEDYTLFAEELLAAPEATAGIEKVEGDGWGTLDTGSRVWRAAELIGDYVRLTGGEAMVNYGYVNDIIVRDGVIDAVVVSPDVTWGAPGYYAYPFYGYGYGWGPAFGYYDLPYAEGEVAELEPFDVEAFDD